MKKYGDMVNGFGFSGIVKSIEVDEEGVEFAHVQNHIGVGCARVYLVPPVWKENIFPKIDDFLLVGGLVPIENRDINDKSHYIAGKAIFYEPIFSSPGFISEITSWKATNPFAIVKSRDYGKVKLSLSSDVWFEQRFPEKGDNVMVFGITYDCGESYANGGIFVRC